MSHIIDLKKLREDWNKSKPLLNQGGQPHKTGSQRIFSTPKYYKYLMVVICLAVLLYLWIYSNITVENKPIICFVHFQRAGGSFVIKQFEKNGYKLPKNHKNGVPIDFSGNGIKFYDYDQDQLDKFVQKLNKEGVTLIAMHWHFFRKFNFKFALNKFIFVTMVRDPLSRQIANYCAYHYKCGDDMDKLRTKSEENTLKNFIDNNKDISDYHNYYTRFLIQERDKRIKITKEDVTRSLNMLRQFRSIGIYEDPNTWKIFEKNHNVVVRPKKELTFEHKMSDEFVKWYRNENKLDYNLYNATKDLSQMQNYHYF